MKQDLSWMSFLLPQLWANNWSTEFVLLKPLQGFTGGACFAWARTGMPRTPSLWGTNPSSGAAVKAMGLQNQTFVYVYCFGYPQLKSVKSDGSRTRNVEPWLCFALVVTAE